MTQLTEILSHLPEEKIAELEIVRQRIVETGMPCMIILYGSFARGNWKEHSGGRSGKKSDYDILILTNDERDCGDLKNKLFKMFDSFPTVVQTSVETIGFVNMHLREGQYFFTEIKQQGIILYTDGYSTLAEPERLTSKRMIEIAEFNFEHWYGVANDFYETYKFNRQRKRFNIASFDLQQCAENCYTTIEMVFSRNNPYEHRLSILRMNASRYVPEINECFPLSTEDERYLFTHLDAAYIGGRYIAKEHYTVTTEHLEYWEKEADKLLTLTKQACERKIEAMKSGVY